MKHTPKKNGLRQRPLLTLFLGVLVFLGIVGPLGDATHKKGAPHHAVTRSVDETHTRKPTAVPSATHSSQPSPIRKASLTAPNLIPIETGKYYQTSSLYCTGGKCFLPTPTTSDACNSNGEISSGTFHAQTRDISGFPGMNKVVINASLQITDKELLFTNNESQDWQLCYASINTDSGPSKWYEYDFSGIPAGQTYAFSWSQLLRSDGTHYSNVPNASKSILLSCVLDNNTIGFAKFHC